MLHLNHQLERSKLFQDAPDRKQSPNAILAIVIFFCLWGGSLLLGRMLVLPVVELLPKDTQLQIAVSASLRKVLVCGVQIAVFFMWVRLIEKRPIAAMGLGGRYKLRAYILSAGLGFGAMSMVIVLLVLTGSIELQLSNQAAGAALIPPMAAAMLGWAVQSASEEIAIRGWLIPVIGARYGPLCAILLTGGVFGAIHLLNPGATALSFINLTLSGVFFALYAVQKGNIWGVCGLHMGWNFAQGSIYGVSISGEYSVHAVFTCRTVGADILTGGGFGPEAGIFSTCLFLCGVLLLVIAISRGKSH